jgi:signal transduction histidine kinase
VLAAGIGWFAAWRAFVRQRQLATMKDNFVSAVSHELKAPIAAIGLMAEELGAGSEKRIDYTRLIAGECARLGSLVENVLDYARIESGSDEFNFEEADIGELVRAAAELMRSPAAEHGIDIRVESPPAGELCATVDARAIGRAVVNLLDNAIKYAPPEKLITLTAAEDRITITDKGNPIPAAEREQIFARFYRSGCELTRETKGVGIGLSLVSHIAKSHSGKAWVESDKTGNCFILQIGEMGSQPVQ